MNIEEAKKVLWLRSKPRPLGELIEEGYLTREKLEWAATYAYNSKLKEAARVLLEATKAAPEATVLSSTPDNSALSLPISLAEAEATLWPFMPHKGQPMGKLAKEQRLNLKDLTYALENAYDPRVRQAATALLLVQLEQKIKEPPPSAGFVKVTSGNRSFAERRQLQISSLEGLIFGLLMGALLVAVLLYFWLAGRSSPAEHKSIGDLLNSPGGIIALVLALAIFAFLLIVPHLLVNALSNRFDKIIQEYRRGQEGEELTFQTLVQVLDGNWHIFRNLYLPSRRGGDIDFVLVGPPGIWALEVKNLQGMYRNVGDQWEYRRGKKWKKASMNPGRQARKNAARLSGFLKANGINVFVNPVIIWVNCEELLQIETPTVAVWLYKHLPEELGNIWKKERLSETQRKQIVEKLSNLYPQTRIASNL